MSHGQSDAADPAAADPESPTPPWGPQREPAPAGRVRAPVSERDERWMAIALDEARRALAADEVPVGAVVVLGERLLARAHNRTRALCDPTAHAEVLALRRAARELGAQRLVGAELFSTVEPCFLCAGACSHARLARVVWGVRDPKFGGCASLGNVLTDPRLNHRVAITEDVLADEARALMVGFFRAKR